MSDDPDRHTGDGRAGSPDQRRTKRQPSVETGDSRIGKVFGGRYRIEDRIGAGGMGVVYRARHTGLDRPVVVKVLTQERLRDETSLQRFEREAKSLSRLDHLNIVTVYDFGREGDLTYLAMEYVDGVELHSLIAQQGWLSMNLFAPIASQILDGVGHAHSKGLVHRDLKPSNIMLTERDESPYFVKLLDFGLAKLVSGDVDVTQKDSILGSIPYLSPEQIAGSNIDQRVDVYSLGVVFYYMLTGRKPFRGSEASIVYDQVHSEPPPMDLHLPDNSSVPRPVTELIHTCLAKNPDNRPDSAYAVLEQLQAVTSEFQPPSSGSHRPPSSNSSSQPISSEYVDDYQTRDPNQSGSLAGRSARADGRAAKGSRPDPSQKAPDSSGSSYSWLVGGIVFGLLLAVTAVGTWYLATNSSDQAAPASGQTAGNGGSLESKLARIDRLIDQKKFSTASSRLEALGAETTSQAARDEIETRRQKLKASRLYAKAERQRSTGDFSGAITTYSSLLEVAPDFRDASQALAKLESFGKLTVEGESGLPVSLDGEPIGEMPLTRLLPPGDHQILVTPQQGEPWRKSLTVEKDETVSLAPVFQEKPEPTNRSADTAPTPDDSPSRGATSREDDSSTDHDSPSPDEEAGLQKARGPSHPDSDKSDDSVLLESGSSGSSEGDESTSSNDETQLLPVN